MKNEGRLEGEGRLTMSVVFQIDQLIIPLGDDP